MQKLAELKEQLLEICKGYDHFDTYNMYDWKNQVEMPDGSKIDGPLKAFYDYLDEQIEHGYTEGLNFGCTVNHNRLEFYLNDSGHWDEKNILFAVIVKRKVKLVNDWGRTFYEVGDINFETPHDNLDDIAAQYLDAAREMTRNNQAKADEMAEKLRRLGVTMNEVNKLVSEWYALPSQARVLLEEQGLGTDN